MVAAVNCQSSVASMSYSITACDFGGKAILSTTFTKTKNLTWGIYVNLLYKQLPGFIIFMISLLWGKIAFVWHCHTKVTWTGCVCLQPILGTLFYGWSEDTFGWVGLPKNSKLVSWNTTPLSKPCPLSVLVNLKLILRLSKTTSRTCSKSYNARSGFAIGPSSITNWF